MRHEGTATDGDRGIRETGKSGCQEQAPKSEPKTHGHIDTANRFWFS
jgi:hypothetical protein